MRGLLLNLHCGWIYVERNVGERVFVDEQNFVNCVKELEVCSKGPRESFKCFEPRVVCWETRRWK